MGEQRERSDRPSGGRLSDEASARLLRKGIELGRYGIKHLTAHRVSLSGRCSITTGRCVEVQLELPNRPGPVSCRGSVERVDYDLGGRVGLEVHFPRLTMDAAQAIEETLARATQEERRGRSAPVLVFHSRRDARARMEAAVRSLGRRVCAVSTPLEALMAIRRDGDSIAEMIVEAESVEELGFEVLELLSMKRGLRIVLVGAQPSTIRGGAMLERIADRFLPVNWSRRQLAAALARRAP